MILQCKGTDMRKIFIVLLSVLFVLSLFNCDGAGAGDTLNSLSAYNYAGTVEVSSTILAGLESFGAKIFGNSEGTYVPSDQNSDNSRAIGGNAVLTIPDVLKRYPDKTFVDRKSYAFESFKIVADILLKPDVYLNNQASSTLLSWGGDGSDVTQFIDLVTGEFTTDSNPSNLYKANYNSILLQVNAPAETIIPDFGSDTYGQSAFSWTDIKPFFSTNSSAQHIVFSTYVTEPFVQWLGVRSEGFESLTTVQEDYQKQVDAGFPNPEMLSDFEAWAFSAPLNQEFFDEVSNLNLTEDPNSGEAWLFMPMNQSIDLTDIDAVTFSFELYMKHLLEVYTDDSGDKFYMLGASKNFKNSAGELFFGPLPIRISYKENENGFTTTALP